MAIVRQFAGAAISKPGAYTDIKVQNLTGFPLQPTGIVGIVGEALGGEPGVLDELSGQAIQAAKDRYKSGPIADALTLLTDPSRDTRIANGASTVIVYKTNPSLQSSTNLLNNQTAPVTQVALKSKNYGSDENGLSIVVSPGSVLDENATILGSIDETFDYSATGDTLVLKVNGVVYTHTSTLSGVAETAAAAAADLDSGGTWAPSKPVIATAVGTKVQIELDPSVITDGELEYGYIEVDVVSTLDTILGIAGEARGIRGSRFLTLTKGSLSEDAQQELGGVGILQIEYTGAATNCKLTILDTLGERKLTTTCIGVPLDDLDIVLAVTENGELQPRLTVQSLADIINNQGNYVVTVVGPNPDLNATELDYYTDLQIEDVAVDLARDIEDMVQFLNTVSELAEATRVSNISGSVATFSSPQAFAGAVDGVATNTNWIDGIDALRQVRVNEVVSLISADKGGVSVDTVNAAVSSHVTQMWSVNGKSERNAYVSKLGSKDDLIAAAQALNNQYVSVVGQDPFVLSESQQRLAYLDPWATACLVAGLQAGSAVGEPTTFKFTSAQGLRVRDGSWDPAVDFQELIAAGVTFLEPGPTGGFRVVLGNTTYQKDASFVWNRVSVIEAAGFVAYDLRLNLEAEFTGTKSKTGTAEQLANFITARMETFLSADIIVGDDDNDGRGFRDLRVTIEGNTAIVNIIITPVQGIDFILPTIFLADIRQSA